MKKMIFALLCAAVMCGCKSKGIAYTVTVSAPDEIADVQLVTYDREMTVLAEAEVGGDNVFTMKGEVEAPMLALVTDTDGNPLTAVFIERGDIEVVFDEENDEFVVSGTPANDNFLDANRRLSAIQERFYIADELTEEEQEAIFDDYTAELTRIIDENNDNILGVYLFANTAVSTLEPAEIIERAAAFPAELRELPMLKSVTDAAEAALKTAVGEKFIEINAVDADEVAVPLSSLVGEGKYVLVDFWATWCGPCRGEMPYLKAAYDKYGDKGFVLYGVSLDSNVGAWKQFVDDNDMNWLNVIDSDGAAADAYGIVSIPTNFLIGPDGTIVAKNLRGEGVDEKLAEIFE